MPNSVVSRSGNNLDSISSLIRLITAAYNLLRDQSKKEDLVDLCFDDRGMVEVKGAEHPLHMFLVSEKSMIFSL